MRGLNNFIFTYGKKHFCTVGFSSENKPFGLEVRKVRCHYCVVTAALVKDCRAVIVCGRPEGLNRDDLEALRHGG